MDFVHLHTHTEYSLLDGLSRIDELTGQVKRMGMPALAITDHGAMYGVVEFYKACIKEGVKPIIGVEAYLTADRFNKEKRYKDDYTHLLMLATNDTGYRNLLKLTTLAHTEGYHLRPRIDLELLEKYHEGIIVTSSCLSGEIPILLLAGKKEEAYNRARWYQDVFGSENFYLEIQEHHGIYDKGLPTEQPSPQAKLNQMLYQMHKDLGIEMVATNDLHYVHADHAHVHDVLLCVQTRKSLTDTKRMRFDSNEYYLKSMQEMEKLFDGVPDALRNTMVIAERCNVNPLSNKASFPDVNVPEGHTQVSYLRALSDAGLQERYGAVGEEVRLQRDYELDMIAQKGFAPYFLIEQDFVNYARSHGIRCSARGSAAGSILAYSLGITNVDPIRYQLPFERFFNVERADMPDIDMDFPDNRRDEVIQYVMRKYGPECVAQLGTFGTMAAKAAIHDVARVHELRQLGDELAACVPNGPRVRLVDALETPDMQKKLDGDKQAQQIIQLAQNLEGTVRSAGVHAAGLIVANEPLVNFVPLQLRDNKNPGKGYVTQYEQKHLEELGLIKFDFLGLSQIAIIDRCLQFIKESRKEFIDLDSLPLDLTGDPVQDEKRRKAFELLASGETTGIFQLEGPKMREYIKQLQPTRLEDIMAMIALYRPGPMDSIPDFIAARHRLKSVEYLDPRLAQWLDESYGVIVYQDQVLFIAVNLAGFSWGKVNKFRKALSKKQKEEFAGYQEDFINGCVRNGLPEEAARKLFDLIIPFGGYGFNKAHAASYAVVAYHTAYLKANYPAEFMAATMTTEAGDEEKIASAIAECARLNVTVFPPDVNKSEHGFTVEDGAVRFGLSAIKGLKEKTIDAIIKARTDRENSDTYRDLGDFCARTATGVSDATLLCKAGAMGCFGDRSHVLKSIEKAVNRGKKKRAQNAAGLLRLFTDAEMDGLEIPFELDQSTEPLDKHTALKWEKEIIGVYLSEHPLFDYQGAFREVQTHSLAEITRDLEQQQPGPVTVCGSIKEVRPTYTKKGDIMCILKLEDMTAERKITIFPSSYERHKELCAPGTVVSITGRLQVYHDEAQIIGDSLAIIEPHDQEPRFHVLLHIESGETARDRIKNKLQVNALYELLQRHPGYDPYEIKIVMPEQETTLGAPHMRIRYSKELHRKIIRILGEDSVEVFPA